jgi:hypothetical protein
MQELVPITLFVSLAYAIQVIADARARSRLVAPHVSEDVISALVLADQQHRRLSSLRWGVVLIMTALGLAVLQVIGWKDLTPGFVAVLVGAIGVGNVASYAITAKFGIA